MPFRVRILTDKIFTIARYMQNYPFMAYADNKIEVAWDHSSVPAMMYVELPTYIGFAENQLS